MAKAWELNLDHAPTQDEGMAIAASVCLGEATNGARTRWSTVFPTPDDWTYGDRTMQCWLS